MRCLLCRLLDLRSLVVEDREGKSEHLRLRFRPKPLKITFVIRKVKLAGYLVARWNSAMRGVKTPNPIALTLFEKPIGEQAQHVIPGMLDDVAVDLVVKNRRRGLSRLLAHFVLSRQLYAW